jgi:hypothetical protein
MALLYARAHWCDDQTATGLPVLQPPPGWVAGLPGAGAIPRWPFVPGSAGPEPDKWIPGSVPLTLWFAVAPGGLVGSRGWSGGAGWGATPPPPWLPASGAPAGTLDQGYAATTAGGQPTTGFRVDRLRIYVPSGAPFRYRVTSPDGTFTSPWTPGANGWSIAIVVPAAMLDGRGLWRLELDLAAGGASVTQPSLLAHPAPAPTVDAYTYITPFNATTEGILGVEIDGREIADTPVVVTPSWSATVGDCDSSGRRPVTFAVTFTPSIPSGWSYNVQWNVAPGVPAPPPSAGVAGGAGVASLTATASYAPGTYYPSATVVLVPPGGAPQVTTVPAPVVPLIVPVCEPPGCVELAMAVSNAQPCVRNGTTGPITFTVTPTPAFAGPYSWQVRDAAGATVPIPAPVPNGPALTVSFTTWGTFTVTAVIDRGEGCQPRYYSCARSIAVASCDCPTLNAPLTATMIDGCTFSFGATVTAGGTAPIVYAWDFGDGQTAAGPPPVTHVYAAGTSGQRTVTLTISTANGCSDSRSTTVNVDCGGPGNCPRISAPIVPSGSGCTFSFAATVTPGTTGPATFTWDFGDGTTSTAGASVSHTYAPGTVGMRTVTLTVTAPGGCSDTASTTVDVQCPGVTPPPTTGCTILLIIALLLLLVLGPIAVVVGVCISVPWVWIVGAALGVIGLVLFIIWAIVCARFTPCSLMRTLHCIMFVMVGSVFPIILLLAAIFGGLPCGLAAAAAWGGWGAVYAWMGFIMRGVGCPPTC